MGAIVSELLAEALARRRSPRPTPPFRWTSRAMKARVRSLGQGSRLRGPGRGLSYSLDANVLLYASDQSSDRHDRARRFVESCAAGPEILCLTWPTLMAYLRIATHPRIFAAPLNPDEALGNVAALVGLPHVRVVSEQDGFLDAYKHVGGDMPVRGNLVPDAHVAAILFQHGVRTLYTHERDFRRFDSLEVRDPFA